VALLIGGQSPVEFLAAHPRDWAVQVAVLKRAAEIDSERRTNMMRSLIEGIGISTGNRVAELLARMRW
jgi:hypothetical protein